MNDQQEHGDMIIEANTTIFKNRIVGHGMAAVADVVNNPLNWRVHPKDQQLALEGVLDEVGLVASIMINVTTGNLVDGHQRVLIADKRGEKYLPATYVELSVEEEQKILATYDTVTGLSLKHKDNLNLLLGKVETRSSAVQAMLDHLRGTRRTEADKDNPEIDFTIELDEQQNYVVFAFDNKFDWNVVVEAFGISTKKTLDSTETYSRQGTGRVLDGKLLVERLKEQLT
jgi:hypothetical protein